MNRQFRKSKEIFSKLSNAQSLGQFYQIIANNYMVLQILSSYLIY